MRAPPLLDPLLDLAAAFDPLLDPPAVRAARSLVARLGAMPLRATQAEARERALDAVAARFLPAARALAADVVARDGGAITGFDALVARAVADLRTVAEAEAAHTLGQKFAHLLDRALYADRAEWLDDPAFDERLRVRTLERLDRLNEAIGSYDAFFAVIEPAVAAARAAGVERPVVVDLASGHGVFAVELALRLGAREGKARVLGTDLREAYLDLGRARADALALPRDAMGFFVQDALDLRDLERKVGAKVDVVVCTQTLHHFPPGFVARMLAEATRAARFGAVLVDGERNAFALGGIAVLAALLARGGLPFMHDSFVSMRRMFTEQELALVARLAPITDEAPGFTLERGWVRPGHVWVRARRR
jgi:SAM-dependent methyltransferase